VILHVVICFAAVQRYATCAVVGNGGALLGDPLNGAAIDRHQAVLRFNDGPTSGFEQVPIVTSHKIIHASAYFGLRGGS
jgi:hypothetical protein